MRAANLALVTAAAYAAPEPRSRAELADVTSVSRATVGRLVDDLVRAGLLVEGPAAPSQGPGRPSIPLLPTGHRYAALGLQVNVRRLTARVVDLAGTLVSESVIDGDFTDSDPDTVLPQLLSLGREVVRSSADGREVVGAGLALPGLVGADGQLLRAPNLGWQEVDIRAIVDGRLGGLPLVIDNEATFAALTAARHAPGRPAAIGDFVYLSGEVGVGGAIVVDGQVLRGRHGWAGEVGHVPVTADGPRCPCGSTGCLETYVGRSALLARAGLPVDSPPAALAAAMGRGEHRAVTAIEEAARALAVALGGVVNVLDVPTVVLGGHLADLGAALADRVQSGLAERVLASRWVPPVVLVGSSDISPAATGAAYVPLEGLLADPGSVLARGRAAAY